MRKSFWKRGCQRQKDPQDVNKNCGGVTSRTFLVRHRLKIGDFFHLPGCSVRGAGRPA